MQQLDSYRLLLFICLMILIGACDSGVDQNLLQGRWKAAQLIEEENIREIDLSLVQFEFNSNETYTYQNNLKGQEAGRYYTIGKMLYSTDTTVTNAREKAVKILSLTADSLFLEMNNNGTPQLLKLYKAGQ